MSDDLKKEKKNIFQRIFLAKKYTEELSTKAYIERRTRNIVFGGALYVALYLLFATVVVGKNANPPALQLTGIIYGISGVFCIVLILRKKTAPPRWLTWLVTSLVFLGFTSDNWFHWDQGEYQFTYLVILIALILYGLPKKFDKWFWSVAVVIVSLGSLFVSDYFPLLISEISREYQGVAPIPQTIMIFGIMVVASWLLFEREQQQIKSKNAELLSATNQLSEETKERRSLEGKLARKVEELENLNARLEKFDTKEQ